MTNVLPFKKPKTKQVVPPADEIVRMIPAEAAKIRHVAKKLNIPQLKMQEVYWPWQATHTARDFGVDVDKYGEIVYLSRDMELIKSFDKQVRFWQWAFRAIIFTGGFVGTAILIFWFLATVGGQ
ncbi:MAG: hypothetical protein ACR2PH_11015 [Desulfobulbia bacterium]